MIKLSCIIPCYKEEGNIVPMHAAMSAALNQAGISYELIFVNDGSPDGSLQVLRKLAQEHGDVRYISFSRNFGKEAAMLAGIKAARGEYLTLIDGDLQQPPEVVLEMVRRLDADADLDCVAAYQENRSESGAIVFCKKLFYQLINRVSELDMASNASDFRTFRRNVADALISMTEYYRFSKGLFPWVGFNTDYIPYKALERHSGKTNFPFWKLMKLAIEGIVAFTTAPLKLATYAGLATAGLSVIYLLVVVVQKLFFGIYVPGYATIVVLILLLGGVQLFFLGIIGEYLARTYIQVKNRPPYIIKESYDNQDEGDNQ